MSSKWNTSLNCFDGISTIASLIGARQVGEADININWLLTDSRSLCFPESTLFFAIRTPRGDGHRYIQDLYSRGVRAFVVEEIPEITAGAGECAFLQVENSLVALQRLAERKREKQLFDDAGLIYPGTVTAAGQIVGEGGDENQDEEPLDPTNNQGGNDAHE